jgi:hypothetical protein
MLGEHQPRAGVGGREHAAEALEQLGQARPPPAQPRRALEGLRRGGGAHLLVEVGEQRGAPVAAAGEERERFVQPAAVEVRVEVAEARRQAAAHLPVGARPVAARQLARAVAQPEQRVELLDELDRRGAPAQRPDADPAARGRGRRDLEDRERDVEPAAQVDVAVDVLEARVPRRPQPLDEPALEQQRAEL